MSTFKTFTPLLGKYHTVSDLSMDETSGEEVDYGSFVIVGNLNIHSSYAWSISENDSLD